MTSFNGFFSRHKKSVSFFAVAAIASSVVAATSISAQAVVGRTGGTLIYVTHADQLNHVDPARVYTGQDIAFLNSYVFRSLTSYTPVTGVAGATIVPDLATTTGTATDGGKTWSFTLKSGIKWEDGSVVTCADEKYGVSRAFAQDVITDGPSYAIQYLDIPVDKDGNSLYLGPYKKTGQAYYDKAVTCSGNTITFHLNKAIGDFNYFGSYPAMSPVKESVDQNSATGGANYDKKPWALGPYKIAQYTIGNQLQLVRNPMWNKATDSIRPAFPDSVVMRFSVAEDTRDQIFLNDTTKNAINYDQGLNPANNVAFFNNANTGTRGLNANSPYVRYYAFNIAKGHLDCLDVRKAIFYAWPTQKIIDLAGGTRFYGTVGDSPVSPLLGPDYGQTTGNIHDSNFKTAGNTAYAATLLAKAKTSCPATYARVTDPKQGFSIDLPNNSTSQKVSVFFKNAMTAAGLAVTFNFINSGTYYSTVQNTSKQGDLSRAGWAADWANASTTIPPLFIKDGGFDLNQNWNDAAYPAFAAKAVAATGETNRTKQAELWRGLAQDAMDQFWITPPIFNKEQYQWGSQVGGAQFWLPQGSLIFTNLYVKQ